MRSWYYVRGIARLERKTDDLTRQDLCVALGISYTTLRRVRRGQPVSSQTLNRIQRGLKKLKYENCLSVEAPTRVLRLFLEPNRVRFNRIEYVEPNSLITVEVLEQLLEGRSFTKSFEKAVRRFLKNILIESREYAIVPIDSARPPRHVEEWKRCLPSLVEGDHMRDLYVFLRNNLSAFIEHSALYDKTHERIKKSGSVSVVELTIPIANMRALSPAEQNLLLTFGVACNELAVLVRLAIFGAHHHRMGRMYEAFAASQQMTIMKLLAGKLHECWKLVRVRYFGSGLSKKYDSIIMPETKADLKTLQRYFKSGSNILHESGTKRHFIIVTLMCKIRLITSLENGSVWCTWLRRSSGMSCISMRKLPWLVICLLMSTRTELRQFGPPKMIFRRLARSSLA